MVYIYCKISRTRGWGDGWRQEGRVNGDEEAENYLISIHDKALNNSGK